METLVTPRRKLIDLKPAVFDSLTLEAKRTGVSLKKYIEDLLESACPQSNEAVSGRIGRLIGSAKPKGVDIHAIGDDRLQYLLSK